MKSDLRERTTKMKNRQNLLIKTAEVNTKQWNYELDDLKFQAQSFDSKDKYATA